MPQRVDRGVYPSISTGTLFNAEPQDPLLSIELWMRPNIHCSLNFAQIRTCCCREPSRKSVFRQYQISQRGDVTARIVCSSIIVGFRCERCSRDAELVFFDDLIGDLATI